MALDFDATLVDLHTGGQWRGTASDLQRHVRPEMTCLIRACHHHGIHVAIATFSTQTDLLRTVVEQSLRKYDADHASSTVEIIPVYGGNDRVAPYWHGKQSQLMLARQYFDALEQTNGDKPRTMSPHEIVLIDDDDQNIAIAHADGYRTIWYDTKHSEADDALVLTKATFHL